MDVLNLISLLGGVGFFLGFIWVAKTSADTVEAAHINDLQDKKVDTDFHDTFVLLTDTPGAYAGEAGKFVKVNAVPDALVFADLVVGDLPSHAAEHELAGGDAIKLDDLAEPDDNRP